MARDSDERRIAARHPDIPQEPLFGLPPDGYPIGSKRDKPKPQKAVRTAECPKCWRYSNRVRIGVIRIVDPVTHQASEVFRDRDKFTHNGGRVPCSGSGTEAPR